MSEMVIVDLDGKTKTVDLTSGPVCIPRIGETIVWSNYGLPNPKVQNVIYDYDVGTVYVRVE